MILLDDDIYRETKEIALGKRKPHPVVADLAAWFRATYAVKVLNIQFSRLKTPGANRYRLYVIIANTSDYQRMFSSPYEPNKEYQQQIAGEFRNLALKHRFADRSQLENLFVIYNDFSDEAMTEANKQAQVEVKALLMSRYPAIWEVIARFSALFVFYYTDADVAVHEAAGTNRAIVDAYFPILKKYDVLNYFTRENIYVRSIAKKTSIHTIRGICTTTSSKNRSSGQDGSC
jgi:hypothetical protein